MFLAGVIAVPIILVLCCLRALVLKKKTKKGRTTKICCLDAKMERRDAERRRLHGSGWSNAYGSIRSSSRKSSKADLTVEDNDVRESMRESDYQSSGDDSEEEAAFFRSQTR